MKRDNIVVNDRQLACARINSEEGQNYLKVCVHVCARVCVHACPRACVYVMCRIMHFLRRPFLSLNHQLSLGQFSKSIPNFELLVNGCSCKLRLGKQKFDDVPL
jgi:hypothetical protein